MGLMEYLGVAATGAGGRFGYRNIIVINFYRI